MCPNSCAKRLLFEFLEVDKSRLKTVFKLSLEGGGVWGEWVGSARSAEFNGTVEPSSYGHLRTVKIVRI